MQGPLVRDLPIEESSEASVAMSRNSDDDFRIPELRHCPH